MIAPNKPISLKVFYYDREDGHEYARETFHKTEASAHERLADCMRRDDAYARYEIAPRVANAFR